MSNFTRQQEAQREAKEKNKNRRDKLASYFFDLSKLIFAGLVIGGVTPIVHSYDRRWHELVNSSVGSFFDLHFCFLC